MDFTYLIFQNTAKVVADTKIFKIQCDFVKVNFHLPCNLADKMINRR